MSYDSSASVIVKDLTVPIRISDYDFNKIPGIMSRKGLKKAIKAGFVSVNDSKVDTAYWLQNGDRIAINERVYDKPIFEWPIKVEFEDEHLAVVNKPAGMLVNGNSFRTVENALNYNLNSSNASDSLRFPQSAHRLDYHTSGLLIIGKTKSALIELKAMFEKKLIQKEYYAVTIGKMPQSGEINHPIDDKQATSAYEVLIAKVSKKYEFVNLLRIRPKEGRTHQIRIHLKSIGHPILGDRVYGDSRHWDMKKGLYLNAHKLSFIHPVSNKDIEVKAELPKKFLKQFPTLKL